MSCRYAEYTDDYDLLLKYYDKVMQYPRNIRALRDRAKTLGKDHPAYGLPAATENGDMYGTAIGCGTTYGEKAEVHNYDGVITGDTPRPAPGQPAIQMRVSSSQSVPSGASIGFEYC